MKKLGFGFGQTTIGGITRIAMPTWEIEGAKKSDGSEIKMDVEATSEAELRKWAARDGILLSRIVPWPARPVSPPPAMLQDPSQQQIKLLMEIRDHLKAISGWVSVGGIILAIALIGEILRVISAGMIGGR